ncbi:MAG: hypothetical protein ACTSYW_09780 [Candidatus Heimdallarchaeota archaeon]
MHLNGYSVISFIVNVDNSVKDFNIDKIKSLFKNTKSLNNIQKAIYYTLYDLHMDSKIFEEILTISENNEEILDEIYSFLSSKFPNNTSILTSKESILNDL